MRAKVARRFYDMEAGRIRSAGSVFELDGARFAAIDAALPGYVVALDAPTAANHDVTGYEPPVTARDTKARIMEYAAARGVALDKSMTKTEMLAALGIE